MKRAFIIICLLAVVAPSMSQYRGGGEDGFQAAFVVQQNPFPTIYKGGGEDGFTSILQTNQNALPDVYHGGVNDGFNGIVQTNQNAMPDIYNGGVNDGFHSIVLVNSNPLPNIYSGGGDDGFNMNLSLAQNGMPGIYKGGANDGWSAFSSTSVPISVIYVFDGTGNWDIASNWVNNLIPPSPLPAGSEIMINPFMGSCILNVQQIISPGAKVTISAGKSLVIPGNLQ